MQKIMKQQSLKIEAMQKIINQQSLKLAFMEKQLKQSTTQLHEMRTKSKQKHSASTDDLLIAIYKKMRICTDKNKAYYLDILSLQDNADKSMIKRKHREFMMVVHPDKVKPIDRQLSHIVTIELNEAYNFFMKN